MQEAVSGLCGGLFGGGTWVQPARPGHRGMLLQMEHAPACWRRALREWDGLCCPRFGHTACRPGCGTGASTLLRPHLHRRRGPAVRGRRQEEHGQGHVTPGGLEAGSVGLRVWLQPRHARPA